MWWTHIWWTLVFVLLIVFAIFVYGIINLVIFSRNLYFALKRIAKRYETKGEVN